MAEIKITVPLSTPQPTKEFPSETSTQLLSTGEQFLLQLVSEADQRFAFAKREWERLLTVLEEL